MFRVPESNVSKVGGSNKAPSKAVADVSPMLVYACSKLCNSLFTQELHRRLQGRYVSACLYRGRESMSHPLTCCLRSKPHSQACPACKAQPTELKFKPHRRGIRDRWQGFDGRPSCVPCWQSPDLIAPGLTARFILQDSWRWDASCQSLIDYVSPSLPLSLSPSLPVKRLSTSVAMTLS